LAKALKRRRSTDDFSESSTCRAVDVKGRTNLQFIRDLLGANPKATLGDAKKA